MKIWIPLVLSFLFLSLTHPSFGATALDYANAGNQLYTAKNYSQAIQYYNAAIGLEPQNTPALQGRANCYYSLGQFQEALADYEKVQALSASAPLEQFLQALRAKVGNQAPGGAPSPSGDSFQQGVGLYQGKQYAAALPAFQKAVQENPEDSKAYYYLGLTHLMLGDTKNAALNLAISNQKQPNPSVAAYVTQLKARLSPEDQQWVDSRLATPSGGNTGPVDFKKMGIRFEPAIGLLDMADFNTNAETNKTAATTLRNSDSTYTFSGNVPTGCPLIGAEAVYRISPELELSVPFGIMAVGEADDDTHNGGSVTVTDSFKITAMEAGVNVRYLIGTGSMQPFIAAGGLVVPISIEYASSYKSSSLTPPFSGASSGTATASGKFSSMGFGGQIQLGLDWHLGDSFAVSPFAGYQLASANNFTATMSGSGASAGQSVQLESVPTADGKVITPVSGGKLVMPVVSSSAVLLPGDPVPAGAQPLTVDLSGLKAGIQVSAFF